MIESITLLPGVRLQAVQTTRFKSACLSLSLLRPLCKEEAAKNALLANVLMQGSRLHPDLQSLSLALDELYGASLGPLVRKNGQIQTLGFFMSCLEDRFALRADQVLEPTVRLLGELLLDPLLENGVFSPEVVALEKDNLINTIESALNDKRAYADMKMLQAMCADDPFGVPRLGEVSDVEAITPEGLTEHYHRILATSKIEIFYAGSAPVETVAGILRQMLSSLPREEMARLPFSPMRPRQEPQYLEETMDLTQGKLAMGFTAGITTRDPDFPALMVLNVLFGGDMTSKLFQNVREKLSLCYYVSSAVYGAKGIVTVSSGIDTDHYQQALDEILHQLELCKEGQITDEELTAAKEAIFSSLRTIPDSVGRMEDYAAFRLLSGFPLEPEAYMEAVRAVTRQDAARVARQLRLDTIYFLKGVSACV